jgi:hypothetical protein
MAKKRNLQAEELNKLTHEMWGLSQDLEEYSEAVVNERIEGFEAHPPLKIARDIASAIHTLSMLQLRLMGHYERKKQQVELEARLAAR